MRHGSVLNIKRAILLGLGLLLMVGQFAQAQLDDPTRPADFVVGGGIGVNPEDVTTAWNLSSILISPQRSVAIINGKTVQTGDMLAGAKVLSIQQTSVKLEQRGEIILLKLFPSKVKTLRDIQK